MCLNIVAMTRRGPVYRGRILEHCQLSRLKICPARVLFDNKTADPETKHGFVIKMKMMMFDKSDIRDT